MTAICNMLAKEPPNEEGTLQIRYAQGQCYACKGSCLCSVLALDDCFGVFVGRCPHCQAMNLLDNTKGRGYSTTVMHLVAPRPEEIEANGWPAEWLPKANNPFPVKQEPLSKLQTLDMAEAELAILCHVADGVLSGCEYVVFDASAVFIAAYAGDEPTATASSTERETYHLRLGELGAAADALNERQVIEFYKDGMRLTANGIKAVAIFMASVAGIEIENLKQSFSTND